MYCLLINPHFQNCYLIISERIDTIILHWKHSTHAFTQHIEQYTNYIRKEIIRKQIKPMFEI